MNFKEFLQESQKVYLSKTQDGRKGLFTNGRMAWPLSDEEYQRFQANPAAFCKNLGFDYEERVSESFLNEALYELVVSRDDAKNAGKTLRELGIELLKSYSKNSVHYAFLFRTSFDAEKILKSFAINSVSSDKVKLTQVK